MLGPRSIGRNGVSLEPQTLDEAKRYAEWAGRPEVSYYWWPRFGEWTPQNFEERYRKTCADPNNVHWSIHVDGRAAGYAGIADIDWVARQGESYIFIGEHELYRHGVASEVIRLRTDFAFRELNLHRVYNWVVHENVGSRRANEKAGYRQRALFPQSGRRGRRYFDQWAGEILRADWERIRSTS